ncbi:MAG: ATP-binding protein [Candidatus Porifericomitaceae bacterium WSBS_2022_MAG_OTU9]
MIAKRHQEQLEDLLDKFLSQSAETELVEFKANIADPEQIAKTISAMANSAALIGDPAAYIVWGVEDGTHKVTGTSFDYVKAKAKGNASFLGWLAQMLSANAQYQFNTFQYQGKPVVLLEIEAAARYPVQFERGRFIRIGSNNSRLDPEKERLLWSKLGQSNFENGLALQGAVGEQVLELLDYQSFFSLVGKPTPKTNGAILDALSKENIIVEEPSGRWNISNMGAVLFARDFSDFQHLQRKRVRVIVCDNARSRIREKESSKGYAVMFENLIEHVMRQIPDYESINGGGRRISTKDLPEGAVRELIANAMIHQDFHSTGTSLMVEVYPKRLQVTSPGAPLVETKRFIDAPPRTRNEDIAAFMRRIGFCEERGSGIDLVVRLAEDGHLPAPLFEVKAEHTIATIFTKQEIDDIDKGERIRACYQHACLLQQRGEYMTNASLRQRFGIEGNRASLISKIIKDTVEAGLIGCYDDSVGNRARKYKPYWA